MHAGACPFGIGLGHEGGAEAVLFGGGLDDALQHDGFVAGFQYVVAVTENDFHLSRCIFGDQRFGGQVLDFAPGIKIFEEGCEIIHVLQMIGLVMLRTRFIHQSLWCAWISFQCRLPVHQEKFKFNSTDGRHVQIILESRHDIFQRIARASVVGNAVEVVNFRHVLRRGHVHPRNALQ